MSTVLEIIALRLSSVLVLKLGCILELLGFFKQCAQATSYSYYLRLSGESDFESTPADCSVEPNLRCNDRVSYLQCNMIAKCPMVRAII